MPTLWHEERGSSDKWEPDGDEEEEGRPASLPLARSSFSPFLWSRVALDGDGKQRDKIISRCSPLGCVCGALRSEEPLVVLMSAIRCYSAIRKTQFHIMMRLGFCSFSPNAIKPEAPFVSEYQTTPAFYIVGRNFRAPGPPALSVGVAACGLDHRRRSWRATPTRGLMLSRCPAMPRPRVSRLARRAAAALRLSRLCGDVFVLLFQPTDHAPFNMSLLRIRHQSARLLLRRMRWLFLSSSKLGFLKARWRARQESERESAPPSGGQSSLSSLFPYFHHKANSLKKKKKKIM